MTSPAALREFALEVNNLPGPMYRPFPGDELTGAETQGEHVFFPSWWFGQGPAPDPNVPGGGTGGTGGGAATPGGPSVVPTGGQGRDPAQQPGNMNAGTDLGQFGNLAAGLNVDLDNSAKQLAALGLGGSLLTGIPGFGLVGGAVGTARDYGDITSGYDGVNAARAELNPLSHFMNAVSPFGVFGSDFKGQITEKYGGIPGVNPVDAAQGYATSGPANTASRAPDTTSVAGKTDNQAGPRSAQRGAVRDTTSQAGRTDNQAGPRSSSARLGVAARRGGQSPGGGRGGARDTTSAAGRRDNQAGPRGRY